MALADVLEEMREYMISALGCDDEALSSASLRIAGTEKTDLAIDVIPGSPPTHVGGVLYSPGAPFRREVLAELVVRMMRYRAARWEAGEPVEPTRDDLMRVTDSDPHACYPSLGPGWTDLLAAMLGWLAETDPGDGWRFTDLKEKYGTLRGYYSGPLSDLGEEIVEATGHLSGFVCDRCGRPGHTGGRGWISARCHLHNGDWR
jgi:hypothetical protein